MAAPLERQSPRGHRLFALTLRSRLPLSVLPPSDAPPDLRVEHSTGALRLADAFFRSPTTDGGPPTLAVGWTGGRLHMQFVEGVDFRLGVGSIGVRVRDESLLQQAEVRLLGPVIGLWMEARGWPVLHASAVEIDGQAVAFLAGNGGGKSTLAAGCVAAGYRLLSDDLLALDPSGGGFSVRPSYPALRLWPRQAEELGIEPARLPFVHPTVDKRWVPVGALGGGGFCAEPRRLAHLVLPVRSAGTEPELVPIPPSGAVANLLAHGFLPRTVEAAGWQAVRLEKLCRLAETVPLHRFSYPEGLDRLPQVVAGLVKALRASTPAEAHTRRSNGGIR